jgi:uncharacterized protein (TIGR01777 family)
MKVVIPGGSGQVGSLLARYFAAQGDEVVVLSRTPHPAPWQVIPWDGEQLGGWVAFLEGADAVINLAGRSVNCRYHAANRRLIIESRVNSTQVVGRAIAGLARPPRVWVQASTATIYAHRFDAPNDDDTGVLGGGEPRLPDTWRFSLDVARRWEAALAEAVTPNTRKVATRSAMVMSPDRGGVFDVLLGLVRRGLGGRAGNGRQYVSWVHDADFCRAVAWIIGHEEIQGPVNIAAPNPLANVDFMAALRSAWGARFGLPAAAWMLELGALLLQTETELVLKSRRVIASRLAAAGFTFDHPSWPEAAGDLCARWRASR